MEILKKRATKNSNPASSWGSHDEGDEGGYDWVCGVWILEGVGPLCAVENPGTGDVNGSGIGVFEVKAVALSFRYRCSRQAGLKFQSFNLSMCFPLTDSKFLVPLCPSRCKTLMKL